MPDWKYSKARTEAGLFGDEHKYAGVIIDKGRVWLERELNAERVLAETLKTIQALPNPEDVSAEPVDGLNAEQAHFVRLAMHPNVRCIALTGAAGTGKTWSLAALAKEANKLNHHMCVMAFSGKAANRASEALRDNDVDTVETGTIHRMLGISPTGKGAAGYLTHDYVVVDEASMLPNWLIGMIMDSLKDSATLVLVGDPAQLPPIGYGTPFRDFLTAGVPHVNLTQNYRQANQQAIYEVCTAIRERVSSEPSSQAAARIASSEDDNASTHAVKTCLEDLHLLEWQVLAWKNDEVEHLNLQMQRMANPRGEAWFSYPGWSLPRINGNRPQEIDVRVGDKLMITRNDYKFEIFNGETYIFTGVERHAIGNGKPVPCVRLESPYQVRFVPRDEAADYLKLGYAVTTHKAQGSGWHTVIVFQPDNVKFYPHSWWYTSVSRASEQLYVFAGRGWWQNAISKERPVKSTLLARL